VGALLSRLPDAGESCGVGDRASGQEGALLSGLLDHRADCGESSRESHLQDNLESNSGDCLGDNPPSGGLDSIPVA